MRKLLSDFFMAARKIIDPDRVKLDPSLHEARDALEKTSDRYIAMCKNDISAKKKRLPLSKLTVGEASKIKHAVFISESMNLTQMTEIEWRGFLSESIHILESYVFSLADNGNEIHLWHADEVATNG